MKFVSAPFFGGALAACTSEAAGGSRQVQGERLPLSAQRHVFGKKNSSRRPPRLILWKYARGDRQKVASAFTSARTGNGAVITWPALSGLYRRHGLINARRADVTPGEAELTACNPLCKHQMLSTALKHTKHSCAVVDPRGNINYHLDEMDSSQIRGN